MAIAKKGSMWRIRLDRVDDGVQVSVLTEPVLSDSFKRAVNSGGRRAYIEASLSIAGKSQTYVNIPGAARLLHEFDPYLTPFIFQENPTRLVCPVSRTKDQLVEFAAKARDFVAKWYEARLQPVSVEAAVNVRLSDPIEGGAA